MKTKHGRYGFSIVGVVAVVFGVLGRPARAEEVVERKLGVGYKVGNGMGFEGGDLIYRAFPHVSFDLQVGYYGAKDTLPDGTAVSYSGVGFAPALQAQLRAVGHTPYLSVGATYMRLAAHRESETVTGSGTGFFVNAGYEWRFASGVGVMLGAGVGDIVSMHFEDSASSLDVIPNLVYFNIEGGVRYFF